MATAVQSENPLLLTRLAPGTYAELPAETAQLLDDDAVSQTAILGALEAEPPQHFAVVCGGMSDLPTVHEILRILLFAGVGARLFSDVGVAGLWRLMDRLDEIRQFPVVVALAGMEGAIFSVLAGLVRAPVVAVPTSVGYGVSAGGGLALNSALGSCAPGLASVNIDNGFGAAQAALRVLNLVRRTRDAAK